MIPRGYLSPTCGECGRTFDLSNAEDAEEWGYGHDCEAPEVSTCDGCGKDYPHALTTWQGHAGQGEYCGACLPVVREANALCTADPCPICDADGPAGMRHVAPDVVRVVNGRTWRRLSNGHYALNEGNRSVSPNDAA